MHRLKLLRKSKKLSTRGLAERVGVSAQAISKYERGLMVPTSGVLIKIAEALGSTEEYLLEVNPPIALECKIVRVCLAKYIY